MLYWLYRNRERLGGGAGLAIDPVCGMQVRTADAPTRSSFGGEPFWFCSDRCRERFDADPARFGSEQPRLEQPDGTSEADPVCGMTVDSETAQHRRDHADRDYAFCGQGSADAIEADPARYATPNRGSVGGADDRKLA